MPELEARSVRVGEAAPDAVDAIEQPAHQPTRYDDAAEPDWDAICDHYKFQRFVTAVCERADIPATAEDARLDDQLDEPEDVHFGALFVLPNETLLFVGSDPTAKDSVPWFAFPIERHAPVPAPESAQAALDMLKTPTVRDIEHEDAWLAPRHGEWWLIPSDLVPVSSVTRPGVASKPYGPSPLGNHVPREYAFNVSDDAFMDEFHRRVDAPESITTPASAVEWTHRQLSKSPVPEGTPDWATIREIGGEVLVRGTIRHRENDHFVEHLGETWHRAQTHDFEVYTGDEVATDIHLDYHGMQR